MGIFDAFKTQAEPAKTNQQRSIVASGRRLDLSKELDRNQLRQNAYEEWQQEAWAYFDAIGEIKYGFGMLAAVMSRIRLFAGVDLDPDSAPMSVNAYVKRQHDQTPEEQSDDEERMLQVPKYITEKHLKYAEKLIKELLSGPGGASGFMRNFTLNMSVAGECYLLLLDDEWQIRSTQEVIVQVDGSIYLREQRSNSQASSTSGVTGLDKLLPKDTYIARMWRPHPRYMNEPESSMLGIREPCDELITLQRMIRTVARSRMNAGILFVPDGLTTAGSTLNEDVASEEELHDELVQDLYDTFTDPIEDEASPSSVVPAIITGNPDMGKAIQHIGIGRETDQWLVERSDRALERILQGIDMPKDVVSGMANVKYSNALQIDASLFKSHIEPLALMLCDTLNTVYFIPAMLAAFPELRGKDLSQLCIWYDPSEVVTSVDPAAAAKDGYDNFTISADAWRRAHGFSDGDAPNEEELAKRFLLNKGTPGPEQLAVLFAHIFPEIVKKGRQSNLENSPVPMPDSAQELLFGRVLTSEEQQSMSGNASRQQAAPEEEFDQSY